jgi:hypothetical protein
VRPMRFPAALTVVALAGLAGSARADVAELVGYLPPHANAVVAVDVQALGAAGEREEGKRAAVLLPKVANLQSLVLGAHVRPSSTEPDWQVAVMRVGGRPSMRAVASASEGFVDSIGGRQAAVCPRDLLCVALDERTVGVVYPADRQFAARWVIGPAVGAAVAGHDYLRGAAAQVGPQVPVVIALDLKDAIGEAGVRHLLQTAPPDWSAAMKVDDQTLARLLAGARGVTLRLAKVEADGADGAISIDFTQDAAALRPTAKQFVAGVLGESGLGVADFGAWEFSVSGSSVAGRGRLSSEGLDRLLSFLVAPAVSAPAEGAAGEGGAVPAAGAATARPKAGVKESRDYYKSVSRVLDSFRPGASLTDSAGWLTRAATRIDQTPADRVDSDLLVWGAGVSSSLREAAAILSAGQQRVRARSSGITIPAVHARTGDYSDPAAAAQARADAVNARRQAQEAVAQQRAEVADEANKALQAALDSRGKIRAAMTEKYGGGF